MALCKKCAKERGILDPSAFDLAEKLFPVLSTTAKSGQNNLAEQLKAAVTATLSGTPLTKCPTCGFTLEDFKRIGRLGCSNCYSIFMEEILPMLDLSPMDVPIQAAPVNEPIHACKAAQEHMELSRLKELMQQAIKVENYEQAAKLRDAIAELKASNND